MIYSQNAGLTSCWAINVTFGLNFLIYATQGLDVLETRP